MPNGSHRGSDQRDPARAPDRTMPDRDRAKEKTPDSVRPAAAEGEMPNVPISSALGMPGESDSGGGGSERAGSGDDPQKPQDMIVVMRVPKRAGIDQLFSTATVMRENLGFDIDPTFRPIPMPAHEGFDANSDVFMVRAKIAPHRVEELRAHPDILSIHKDTKIAPFRAATAPAPGGLALAAPQAQCAITPCDTDPGTPKGSIQDVVRYLGVDAVWNAGHRGRGMRIGIVDGGITAVGRTPRSGETSRIARVVAGWPSDWGTTAADWGDHGNMTATDALGIAPEAEVYDIRISDESAISAAIAGYQWAIERHRQDGTPQVLSNSWGIYEREWDPDYAENPNHPFTLKVVEAIRDGIIVLFAAGNCGSARPSARCAADAGPGRSIWGANGHPLVMTVGAANTRGEWIGYSSQGPAALDPNKPDFCGISHFVGYFGVDSGTSAACPVVAGVTALLKEAKPDLSPAKAKEALQKTTIELGPAGWDQHSGFGIIQAKRALDYLVPPTGPRISDWQRVGGFTVHAPAVATFGPRTDLFAIGIDNALWHNISDGSGWGGWRSLGGRWMTAPAAVYRDRDRLHVFAVGFDRAVWQRTYDGRWGEWGSLGGRCEYGIAVTTAAPNRMDLFTIGPLNELYRKSWTPSGWSQWDPIGDGVLSISAPTAASSAGRVDIFVIDSDSELNHRAIEEGSRKAWGVLDGRWLLGAAASSRNGRVWLFGVSTTREIGLNTWDGSSWRGWRSLGGNWYTRPASTPTASGIDVFAVGADNAIYRRTAAEPTAESANSAKRDTAPDPDGGRDR